MSGTAGPENPVPRFVRAYDLRGIAGVEITPAVARSVAHALTTFLDPAAGPVVVGRDCRLSSEVLADSVAEGFLECGFDVVDLGVCPTPLMNFALHRTPASGGLQITASHNPAEQNGFKLCAGREPLHGEALRDLWRRSLQNAHRISRTRGTRCVLDIVSDYQSFVRANTPLAGGSRRVVVDSGNGTAAPVAVPLLRSMGFDVVSLNAEMDGHFPKHPPDPTVAAHVVELCSAVRQHHAMLGLAYDGDADRLVAVDELGDAWSGDQLLMIFARDLLARHPGAAIVGEVKCSEALYRDIRAHGGRDVMWMTGSSRLRAKLVSERALLAGEMSGHFFFADRYFGYDDAIYASVRLLELLLRAGRPASAWKAALPRTHATGELRVPCEDEHKNAVVEALVLEFRDTHAVVQTDGARISFARDGWALVRASNTEPMLSIRCEASTLEHLGEIRARVGEALAGICQRRGARRAAAAVRLALAARAA